MERRKFLQYAALSGASFLVDINFINPEPSQASRSKIMRQPREYDWIFLYWMPYDNNLSRFGLPILEMLKKGVQSDNILVVVQSKFSGIKHLKITIITKNNVERQNLEATNSSSEVVFAEYLNWAMSQFDAKKWAIAILGHGGRLDEISPDEHPEPGVFSGTKWMNIQKLSEVISTFNHNVNNRVELFFFQNCNKGTIEASYTFRDTAKYTLASQLELGAPNYYYESLFQYLGRNPDIHGGQLAEKIMEFEPSNMYHSYTAINNQALRQIPEFINPLIDSLISSNAKLDPNSQLIKYSYMEEQFVDVVSLFQSVNPLSGSSQKLYQKFTDFLNHSILYKVRGDGTLLNPISRSDYQNLSGLGVLFPKNQKELEKYGYLNLFSDLKLLQLFDAILLS